MGKMKWAAVLMAAFALCVFLIGCSGGGGQTATPSKPSTPTSTITGISVSISSSSITTAQTATCTATVSGTGSFSKDVTWTATGGTITAAGVFTPAGVGTGSCKATSVQDSSFSNLGDIQITKAITSPEGVYSGTTSKSSSFEAIILPDSSVWALYGTTSNNVFLVEGVLQGTGSYSGTNYTANGWDSYYMYPNYVYAFSATATFVPGQSINGTLVDASASGTSSFSATTVPTSSFNYDATPKLSDISGFWSGALLGGVAADATIQQDGTFSGTSQGCSFTGTIAPDSSGHNLFDVTIKYGAGNCSLPGVTQTGIAVDYLLSDAKTQQLVAAVHDSTHGNNVFIANR
jgi:hypothetical protein